MKNKRDAKIDNIEKLECNISNTIENIHAADKEIEEANNDKTRVAYEKKNEVREENIKNMRAAIKDERAED